MKATLEHGTKLVQAVADALFDLPSTEDLDGPIVQLPPPTTKLPRAKPVWSFLLLSVRNQITLSVLTYLLHHSSFEY